MDRITPRRNLLVILSLCAISLINGQDYFNGEEKLVKGLLTNYQLSARPAKPSETLDVYFGLSLQEIRDLDPQTGTLFTHAWLNLQWKDPRLTWNEEEYGGLSSIRLDKKDVWIPDILPANGKLVFLSPRDTVIVYSDGRVSWVPQVDLTTSCTVDLHRFPYDQQKCKMKFLSWTYDGTKINVTLMWNNLDISTFTPGISFNLINHTAVRAEMTYACCPEAYIDLTYTLTLKRVSRHATHMLVAPSVTLALLLPVLFLLPADSAEKTQLGAGLLVTHAVLLSIFTAAMPIQHFYSLPLLGVYHITNLVLVCFAIVFASVIRNIWNKGQRNVYMPHLIRTVFLGVFGRMLCVRQDEFITGEGGAPDPGSLSDKDQEQILERSSHAIAAAQWRQLAVILDRICFILFCLTAVITVIRFAAF